MDNLQRPVLIVQEGPNAGEIYVLEELLNTIGRTQDNQVVVDSTRISRRHVQIKVLSSGTIIEDMGSTNGTWINGQRLTDARRLNTDDIIQLADYISFRYVMPDRYQTARFPLDEAEVVTHTLEDYTDPPQSEPAQPATYTPAPESSASIITLEEESLPAERSTWSYVVIGALVLGILICIAIAIYLWFAPVEFWYWLFELLGVQYP